MVRQPGVTRQPAGKGAPLGRSPMAKSARHEAILDLIRAQRVASQDQLRELLEEAGYAVTQATVSRDIRELRLVKVSGAEGIAHYTLPEELQVPLRGRDQSRGRHEPLA